MLHKPLLQDFFSNDLKPDCGDDAIKKFKLVKCGINQYKYDYTCLRGVNAQIGQPQETCPVTKASLGAKIMDASIDLRTMYRHNVSCTIGTSSCHSNRTNTNGEQVSTQNIGVTTPLSQFRYDFGKNEDGSGWKVGYDFYNSIVGISGIEYGLVYVGYNF